MKYEMLRESVGYHGTIPAFKKNLRYSAIVKEFGRAIKQEGVDKAFYNEYLYHESSYDEERFRIVSQLSLYPNLTVQLSEASSQILFEGYFKPILDDEPYQLDEGVMDMIKKIIEWIGGKFAVVFLRGKKRKELVKAAAEDMKDNPTALPDKISEAMKANQSLPKENHQVIKQAVEAGKAQAQGNNLPAQQLAQNLPKPASTKVESFKTLEKLIYEDTPSPITSTQPNPIGNLLAEIWKFIGNAPLVGPLLQGALSYMGPMLISMTISQILYRALNSAQHKKQTAQQAQQQPHKA
jgi:hypothetical protein